VLSGLVTPQTRISRSAPIVLKVQAVVIEARAGSTGSGAPAASFALSVSAYGLA